MVSCSGFGLPLHAQLLRLFVTSSTRDRLPLEHQCWREMFYVISTVWLSPRRIGMSNECSLACNGAVCLVKRRVCCYKETRWLGMHKQALLQRDAIVGHAEAIRTQSRKPSKAHTHNKLQPTNAGQKRYMSHKRQSSNQTAVQASDTPHPVPPRRRGTPPGAHDEAQIQQRQRTGP